jgi:hypothetical protein
MFEIIAIQSYSTILARYWYVTTLYSTTRTPLSGSIPNLILKVLQQLFIHVVSTAWTVFTASMIMAAKSTQPIFLQIHGGHAVCLAIMLVFISKVNENNAFFKETYTYPMTPGSSSGFLLLWSRELNAPSAA